MTAPASGGSAAVGQGGAQTAGTRNMGSSGSRAIAGDTSMVDGGTSGVAGSGEMLGGSSSGGSGSGGTAAVKPPDPHPAWLAGYFSNPGHRLTNSATNEASLSLSAAGSYSYKSCHSCTPSDGKWSVSNDTLTFDGGLLAGKSYDLSTYLTPNCRILKVDGHTIWKSSKVSGCPFMIDPLTTAECAVAGTYTKHEETNGDTTSFTYDYELVVDTDRFYSYEYSSDKSYCLDSGCSFFTDDYEPEVGTWKSQPPKSTAGYSFSHAAGCVGVPGGDGGNGGSGGSGGNPPQCTASACLNTSTLNYCSNGTLSQVDCASACVNAGYDKTTGCGLNTGTYKCLCQKCDDPCGCNPISDGYACGSNLSPRADQTRLYLCSGNASAGSVSCPSGCHAGGLGEPDYCESSSSNPCMNNPYDGAACGANLAVPLTGLALSSLYTCKGQQTVGSVICANGCYAAPPGEADHCL